MTALKDPFPAHETIVVCLLKNFAYLHYYSLSVNKGIAVRAELW